MAQLQEVGFNVSAVNVALVTTAETMIISSGQVAVPYDTARCVIIAWAQLTTGAGTTTVTPRIRRGALATGALVGEANAEEVKAAAGSTEPLFIMGFDDLGPAGLVEYNLTLAQAGATGNGNAVQAGIVVLVF